MEIHDNFDSLNLGSVWYDHDGIREEMEWFIPYE